MDYIDHLKKDSILFAAIGSQPKISLHVKDDLFSHLCSSIISQQLSTKVAAVISERFFLLFKSPKNLAKSILDLDFDSLRSVGLSNSKANYIRNLSAFYLEHERNWKLINEMKDAEIIEFLTQIKGIGRWTVEMLLMFALGREDVFPDDDLGIQQAMIRLYDIQSVSKKELKEKMRTISASWSPYRTYACLHLWRWKDA